MADSETRQARAAVIMLAGVVSLVLAAIVFFRPRPGDCAIFPNGVIDCGPPRQATGPLLLASFGFVVFGAGVSYLLAIHRSIRTPSGGHEWLGADAIKHPKGFRESWRVLIMSSVAAAPVQMISIGLVVIAFGLLLAWVSPGALFWPVGILILGALGVYHGLRRTSA